LPFLRENVGKFWLEPYLKMIISEPILAQNAREIAQFEENK